MNMILSAYITCAISTEGHLVIQDLQYFLLFPNEAMDFITIFSISILI